MTMRLVAATLLALSMLIGGCATVPTPADDTFERARAAWEAEDYEQALILMQPAAQRGNPQAQYALGYMYYNGQGTEVNEEVAMEWIRRSAEQGHRPALQALSQLAALGVRRQTPPAPPAPAEPESQRPMPQPQR
jgi:TPR repeat protein